jgi:hypothetical protein
MGERRNNEYYQGEASLEIDSFVRKIIDIMNAESQKLKERNIEDDDNLIIKLSTETIASSYNLREKIVTMFDGPDDPQLFVDIYDLLQKKLIELEMKSSGSDDKTRSSFIRLQITLVKKLLKAIPPEFIAATLDARAHARANARTEPARRVESEIEPFEPFGPYDTDGGRRRKRSGRKCKRTMCKKRKCITRRRLRHRH